MFHDMERTTTERTAAIVRAEAARHKLSTRELGKLLNRSRTTVWRRLNGEYPFDVEELSAIADRLGIPVGAFFVTEDAA
jgi:transcriptional regulator with XRE-family HTH domain